MSDYDVNAYSGESQNEYEAARPRIIRHRPNYFELLDQHDFFKRFRLRPRTVENLLEQVEEAIEHPTPRNSRLTASQQVLLTLNFFAKGSFLRIAGEYAGMSSATASRAVRRVSQAIATLRPQYIQMPVGEEINVVRQKFYNIARFPRCIGAIDGTHIKIDSPGGNTAKIFRNKKQFFSLIVQLNADAGLKVRDIVSRWPGSAHDSFIFRNSNICAIFERSTYGDSVLLGDSGYPVKPYLITPLQQTRNDTESLYNESQIRSRNVVERTIGVWKRRFPALAMGLRLNMDTVQAVIVATAILNNIARDENETDPPINPEQEAAVDLNNGIPLENQPEGIAGRLNINNRPRHNLIYNYFRTL